MAQIPPMHNETRLVYVPFIEEHAMSFPAPSVGAAREMAEVITAIQLMEEEHNLRSTPGSIQIQKFDAVASHWIDVPLTPEETS